MLDIKLFRENPKAIKESEKKRGHNLKTVDEVIRYDEFWIEAVKKVGELKHKRNVVSEEINKLKKEGKSISAKVRDMHRVVADIDKLDKQAGKYLGKREELRAEVGNILNESVPIGKDESDNIPIKFVGGKTAFRFPVKDHIEFGRDLDLFEFEAATDVAGARFVYFKNESALLDLALQKFAVDFLVKQGFKMYWPPLMLNRKTLAGGVNLNEFKEQIYKIEDEDLYLIGTSEHPLVALRRNKLLQEKDLPLKIGAYSTCFRKEAGSHGRDTKGTIRMHQFNKVEQVVYCKPEDSGKYFKELHANAEKLYKLLGIPFRVVNTCTGDLGNKQSIMWDIEAWFPGQNNKRGAYREIGSCSNCTDYQAETLNTKFIRKNGKKEYVHMLNNTALATSRVIPAILENFQQKDGSIKIPKVLWKYTGFKVIKKK